MNSKFNNEEYANIAKFKVIRGNLLAASLVLQNRQT